MLARPKRGRPERCVGAVSLSHVFSCVCQAVTAVFLSPSLSTGAVVVAGEGFVPASARWSAWRVLGPTTPSGVSPDAVCRACVVVRVVAPKVPSTVSGARM